MKKILSVIIVFIIPFIGAVAQSVSLGLPLGHNGGLFTARFSPDGKYVVTASDDLTADIWDAVSGKFLRSLEGHTRVVTSAQWSPDGKYIVTSSRDDVSKVWEASSGKLMYNLEGGYTARWSPDGKKVATVLLQTVKIWDVATGRLLKILKGHTQDVRNAFWSADGKRLVTASYDSTAKIWDAVSGTLLHDLKGHTGCVNTARFSPDGNFILTGSMDNTAGIWDAANGSLLYILEGHNGSVESALYSRDGMFIITRSWDGSNNIWESSSGRLQLIIDVPEWFCTAGSGEFSPDGNYIVTTGDSIAKIWDRRSGNAVCYLKNGRHTIVYYAQFSPDGKYVLTACSDGSADIWVSKTGKLLHSLQRHTRSVSSAAFSPDGKLVVAAVDSTVQLWESSSGKLLFTLSGHKGWVYSARFSPDGKYIVSCSDDNTARIWETGSGKPVHSLEGHEYSVRSAEFSSDGKYIITASSDERVKIWECSSGKLLSTLNVLDSSGAALYAEFSPDGKYIVTSGTDGKAKLWDFNTLTLMRTLQGQKGDYIWSARFSPDGKNIVTGSDGKTAGVWDRSSGALLFVLKGHTGGILSAQYSPDGKYIITASHDKTVKIWESQSGKIINTIDAHSQSVLSAQFSPDGRYLITTSNDTKCKLWDFKSGKEILTRITVDKNDFLSVTPDKYYYGTAGAVKLLCWIGEGNKIYPFEQFDLQYNRPDMVLERLGLADTSLINAYRKAYFKRLKKMRFDEGMFSPDFHMPEIVLLNSDSISGASSGSQIVLRIKATDTKYLLDRINIWVNDVAVSGVSGIDLHTLHTGSLVKEIPITLSQGVNKIQVSCLNEKGVESLRETAWADYEPKVPHVSNVYVVSISVSDYKDARYDLKYSVKDGRDMARTFAAHGHIGGMDTLFNQRATRENILALKQKLMQTTVDDEVILYISGHGLLDKNFDFYFATWDMNFEDPGERGILYEDLEGLLDGIPARKKLLLMDACHSGEVDKDEIEMKDNTVALADGTKGDIKSYGYKGIAIDKGRNSLLGLQNSFELMQSLFSNLSRGSGAMVISAASGTGFALESPEWNNGVFTYCILNGLKNLAADANGDGTVSVNELKNYVSAEVEKLTRGAQRPTSRRESLDFDWKVW